MVLLLLRVLNHHNFQAQCIPFDVCVLLHHMLQNMMTMKTIDQVCHGILVDPDRYLLLLRVLNHHNPLVQYRSFNDDAFPCHRL